jgi:hypothetical protein
MDNVFISEHVSGTNQHAFISNLAKIEYFRGKWDVLHTCTSEPPENILLLNAGADNPAEPESRGSRIAKAVLSILQAFHVKPDHFELSVPYVCDLHRQLFHYSPDDAPYGGLLRDPQNTELDTLLNSLQDKIIDPETQLLFSVSHFRAVFLRLMPFITANALLVNILCYCILVRGGYGFIAYLPFLKILSEPPPNLSGDPSLLLSAALVHVIANNEIKTSQLYINPRRQKLLDHISQSDAPMKISDIMAHFTHESRNTVKKDLLFLKDKRLITAKGERRGVVYLAKK